jgi:acyl-coenzyme A thioesterase PaaI-like protein
MTLTPPAPGDLTAALEAPTPGWTPFWPRDLLRISPRFVSGEDGDRLRVRYFSTADRRLVARAWFGPGAEGPPGHAHGGSMLALLDESMGLSAWLGDHAVLAIEVTGRMRNVLPLGTIALVDAWIEGVDGRKVRTRGLLHDGAGRTFCEGEGLFLRATDESNLSFSRVSLGGSRPGGG